MGEYDLVKVVKSDKPKFDYYALFKNKKTGKEKRTYFGDANMDHYNIHRDKERRERYRKRHERDLRTNDPTRAGYLSYYLLWGESTSLRTNLANYKKRFFGSKSMSSPKPGTDRGLKRWFAEEWVTSDGKPCGTSDRKLKKCRPKYRINEGTPVTWDEMSPSQKRKAISEKKQVGMGKRAGAIKKKTSPVIRKTSRKKKTSPVRRKTSRKKKTSPVRRKTSPTRKTSRKKLSSPARKKKTSSKGDDKPVPADPALYAKAKAKAKKVYKIWPSAYGSAYLVSEYKRMGGTYK